MRKYIALAALAAILPFTTAAGCEKNPDCIDDKAISQSMKPECKPSKDVPRFVPGSPATSSGKAE